MKLLLDWFSARMQPAASYLVAQSINAGRNSLWKDSDILEYSAILDGKTTPGCRELDNKRMTWREWQRYPEYLPPRHFNCRSTFVRIDNGKTEPKSEPDHEKVRNLDYIQNTTKREMIQNNPAVARYTKEELLSLETYKGNGYIGINQALLGNGPISEYAKADINQLDKAIRKTTLGEDTVLYRGVGFNGPLKVGQTITNPNFLSTSTERRVALDFAERADDNRYLLVFNAPKNMPYLHIEKTLQDNDVTSMPNEAEYLLSRGKKLVVKSLKKEDNGVVIAEVYMTDDTKYLGDDNDTILTDEFMAEVDKEIEEIRERRKDPNYKPSPTAQRLHHIWQMESEYFNSHPEAIASAEQEEDEGKNSDKTE